MAPFRHILVPVDFGDPSAHAVDLALAIAAPFDAQVTLLHVAWMPPYYYSAYAEGLAFPIDDMDTAAKKMLGETLARAKARYPRTDSKMAAAGDAWEKILETAKELAADLIVMGTHGRHGVARVFLGSVAEKIVRHSPIPVLTTAGPGGR